MSQPTPMSSNSQTLSTLASRQEIPQKKSRTLLTLQYLLARGLAEKNPSLIQAVHRSALKYLGPLLTIQLMQEGMPQPPIPMSMTPTSGSTNDTAPSTI